jgi:heme exporter protein C
MPLPRWFHLLGSPPFVYRLAGLLRPWLGAGAAVLIVVAGYWGLAIAPTDRVQGEVYRIIYLHPQTAYVSLMAYTLMAVAGAIGYVWRIKLAHAVATTAAPIGAAFTVCALVTGAIWGRPTWGTYWQWSDPRIMSETLLLFLFLGYLALRAAFEDRDKADRVSAILAVVGIVNVPVIKYSVVWWNTLHQGPSITLSGAPSIAPEMLTPFVIMFFGMTLLFYWLLLNGLQGEIVERERDARWIREMIEARG